MKAGNGRALWLGLALLACSSTRVPDPGGDCLYPEAPDGLEGAVRYLCGAADGCGDGREGEGTADAPHCTVSEALAAAPPGPVAVLIAAGEYRERVLIERSDVLLAGPTGARRAVLRPPAGANGLVILGASGVVVRGLDVEGATEVGVRISGGEARIEDVAVAGVASRGGRTAFGVLVDGGAAAELVDVRVRDPAGLGVMVDESTATIAGGAVSGATAGGIRLQRTTEPVGVRDVEIADCAVYGIGLYGADAEIEGGAVRDIRRSPDGEGGDAVVVAPLTGDASAGRLTMRGVGVAGSARLGVLLDAPGGATLTGNVIEGNDRGGVWAQRTAPGTDPVVLEGNTLVANRFVGIGAVRGARVVARDNDVERVEAGRISMGDGTVEIGDGVFVHDGADIVAEGNTVAEAFRAAVLIDSSTARIADSSIERSPLGLVLQNRAQAELSGNRFVDVDRERFEPMAGEELAVPSDIFSVAR